ncbi:MAG: hypothetical protein R3335_01010 [Anaerolineales bacterium]|nr:hypothetical protein [Anaerolineales bacterium]
MINKKILSLLAVAIVLSALLFATGLVSAGEAFASVKFDAQLGENIVLDSLVFNNDRSVTFRGRTADQTDACLPVKVLIDGERGGWWPVYRCVAAGESGVWMVRVPFDGEGIPAGIQLMVGN